MCRCRDVRMLVMMSLLPGRVASEDGGEVEDGSTADFGIEATLPSGVHPIRRECFNVWSDAVRRAEVDDQAEGSPERLDATGTRKLSDEPAAGVVTVRWRVVSSDGHSISDEYTFTVETTLVPTSELTTTNMPSLDDETAEPSPTSTDSGYGDIHSQPNTNLDTLPFLAVAGGSGPLGGAALLIFVASCDRRRRIWRRSRRRRMLMGPNRSRHLAVAATAAAGIVVIDQATKAAALAALSAEARIPLLGDLFGLQLASNPGAILSLGSGFTGVLTLVGAGAVVWLIIAVLRARTAGLAVAFGFILGSALGNLIDRLSSPPGSGVGYVTDFLACGNLFIGNLADVVLGIGVILLLGITWTRRRRVDLPPSARVGAGAV